MPDSVNAVLREQDDLLDRDDLRSLLLSVPIFLERLDAEPKIHDVAGDVERETASLLERYHAHDAATIARLKALRQHVPPLPVDETEAPALAGATLKSFDAVSARKTEIPEVPEPGDDTDRSTAGALIRGLQERLEETTEPLRTQLRSQLREIEKEHDHVTTGFLQRGAVDPGFALRRLRVLARQLNPRPGPRTFDGPLFDEHYRVVYCQPESVRKFAAGARPDTSHEATGVRERVREDVRNTCRELVRRLGVTRSREGLLQTYGLRCEWYDTRAVNALAESLKDEDRKEDLLADHLALFLFDNGLRPLTRSMVGRLIIPDLFESFPAEPSFYVEAKQYGDAAGARKAIADGPKQIWSTAHTLSGRYELREAFLVVFRRGGPLLRFEGPASAAGLTLRPILIDVAPPKERGSRQKEIIDVTVSQLLASSS